METIATKKRILFVDDEPKVLAGLKRMLRSMHNEWEMVFVPSGEEALEAMATESFDVLVSDMRMPGMDGVQLLNEVKNRYPQTVRIILSGQAKEETILSSVGPSHQYLSKPCDPEALKSTITRACALIELADNEILKKIISQMSSLPSLPSLYIELLELLKSPDVSSKAVGQIIEKDIAMTTKVLQIVNSAYFGVPRHITNTAAAVNLLGLDIIRALVLSVKVFSQFDQPKLPDFSIENLWQHAMGTAVFARKIAQSEKQDRQFSDDAFMAGLLHDVGKLLLAANLPEQFGETVSLAKEQAIPHFQAEKEVYGTTHTEIGAYLLGLWGLPSTIADAVAYHHKPRACSAEDFTVLTAVHTGDAIYVTNAVHAANIFDHLDHPADVIGAPQEIDVDYLAELGIADRLGQWRELCLEVSDNETTDA